jgi:hypothetical protein
MATTKGADNMTVAIPWIFSFEKVKLRISREPGIIVKLFNISTLNYVINVSLRNIFL